MKTDEHKQFSELLTMVASLKNQIKVMKISQQEPIQEANLKS